MKRVKSFAALALAGLMLVGCATAPAEKTMSKEATKSGEATTQTQSSGAKEIHLVSGKIEIDQQLKDYAKLYEEKTGIPVKIESLGGGVDIAGQLKGYLASGQMPDIFVFGGAGEYNTWKDILADLSDEEWVKDTDFAFKAEDKVVGFPYAVEGYGLTYNKDLLDKAGIDPATLTSYEAYKAAFEKLDSMKEELGIVAVGSIAAESGQMYWSMGNHDFGIYLSGGLDRNDTTYIDMLLDKKIDEARMKEYGEFVKLLFDYADKNVLLNGSYDDQLALWAEGKTVFVHQGNWVDPSLETYNVKFGVGISPLAFGKEPMDGILADTPSYWGVYKDSPDLQEAKDFLKSLAMSEEGANALVVEAGMISPFKSVSVEPTTPLAVDLMKWVKAGKTYSWQWTKMPEGFATNVSGPVFENFARGDVDVDGFVELMKNAIANQ